jgi:hypothetical protein
VNFHELDPVIENHAGISFIRSALTAPITPVFF